MTSPGVVNFSREKHSVEIRDVPQPQIGPDDVLLEVAAVGVCGSDLHQWTADHSWPVNYPVVLGHEFGGHVREVGRNVAGWREGDRAVSETAAVIDPNNPMSRQGLYNLDPTRKGFGYGVNGAMTRFVSVPARCLHRIPDGLPFEKAALTEPCCVAYNAVVRNAKIEPGDRVVVFGPGPIGLLCAAMARLCGAEVAVVGLERDHTRLQIAKQYGCEPIVGGLEDWARATDGLGRRWRHRRRRRFRDAEVGDADRAAQRVDQQSRLGPAAAQFLARSARAEEHPAAGKLQPQLADLGARAAIAGNGKARRSAHHRRSLGTIAVA